MSDSDNGEVFIFDREVVVLIKPKIRVLDRFKAKDLKIGSFVKLGFVRCSSLQHWAPDTQTAVDMEVPPELKNMKGAGCSNDFQRAGAEL